MISGKQIELLKFINTHPECTVEDIMENLDITINYVYRLTIKYYRLGFLQIKFKVNHNNKKHATYILHTDKLKKYYENMADNLISKLS